MHRIKPVVITIGCDDACPVFLRSATSTGNSKIPLANPSTKSPRSATTSQLRVRAPGRPHGLIEARRPHRRGPRDAPPQVGIPRLPRQRTPRAVGRVASPCRSLLVCHDLHMAGMKARTGSSPPSCSRVASSLTCTSATAIRTFLMRVARRAGSARPRHGPAAGCPRRRERDGST